MYVGVCGKGGVSGSLQGNEVEAGVGHLCPSVRHGPASKTRVAGVVNSTVESFCVMVLLSNTAAHWCVSRYVDMFSVLELIPIKHKHTHTEHFCRTYIPESEKDNTTVRSIALWWQPVTVPKDILILRAVKVKRFTFVVIVIVIISIFCSSRLLPPLL